MAERRTGAGPGWRDDPSGRHEQRWHTGTHWTTAVRDGGVQAVDDPTRAPEPAPIAKPARPKRSRRRLHLKPKTTRVVLASTVGVVMLAAFVVVVNQPAEGERSVLGADDALAAERSDTTTTAPTVTTIPLAPSDTRRLQPLTTIGGPITPKSVVASGDGFVFAQNMMYNHSVTVYDQDGALVKTIPDAVDLTALGVPGHPGLSKGAPVEAAFSKDHRYGYVANYSMYGEGFGPEGSDDCVPGSGYDESFVYRVDTETLEIDQAIQVGAVPKYLEVTPDDRYLLVSNWCTYDLSVVDTETNTEVTRIPLGAYPRGIAVDPESTTAYVAVMGERNIAVIDLETFGVSWIANVGTSPRHLVMDPAGQFLYVTLNGDGQVAKIDLATQQVVTRVNTGSEPRSMAIAPDGLSLYVVNYSSNTLSKLSTADLSELQVEPTPPLPIGITVDPVTGRVWVAIYSGSILVFDDV